MAAAATVGTIADIENRPPASAPRVRTARSSSFLLP